MAKDILYCVGGANKDDRLLKYSLRSLAQYAHNLGRVIIAGKPPAWLSGEVVKFPFADSPLAGLPKQQRMAEVIFAAIEAGAVQGDFLYSSDDHFYGEDCDLDNFPFFIRQPGVLLSYAEATRRDGGTISQYNAMLDCTRRTLLECGYGIELWCGHVNTHMDSRDLPAVKELVAHLSEYDRGNYYIEPTVAFMAARQKREPVLPTMRDDIKIYGFDPERMSHFWSCGDWDELDNELRAHLAGALPPCRFEAEAAPLTKPKRRPRRAL